jgi:hypothetical protein
MLSFLLIAGGTAYAQEGRKNWKTEHTLRLRAGLFTEGVMFTSGIRVDEKRTLGLFAGLENVYDDATPADIHSARLGITFRRYWHLGERKIISFYSDLYAGAR